MGAGLKIRDPLPPLQKKGWVFDVDFALEEWPEMKNRDRPWKSRARARPPKKVGCP